MIRYSIAQDIQGAVIITVESLLGTHPVMWFKTWADYREFYDAQQELVKRNEPDIPDVYKDAFRENRGDNEISNI